MQICTAFAALAGYVAFFHTSRALAFTLVMAFSTATICAVEIGSDWDPFGRSANCSCSPSAYWRCLSPRKFWCTFSAATH